MEKIRKSIEEWKALLAPDVFTVTRQHGTERAFSGCFWAEKAEGTYTCACCHLPLFDSRTKYDSGTGWPSFWAPIQADHVATLVDTSFGMRRVEVLCARCDAHLGHVFDDGPPPTGLRYCINSLALGLLPED